MKKEEVKLDKLKAEKSGLEIGEKGTSLWQLFIAIFGFIASFAGSVIGSVTIFKTSDLPSFYYKLILVFIIAGTWGAYAIGGRLFPAEKYGKVNVSRIVWSVVLLLVLATVGFIIFIALKR